MTQGHATKKAFDPGHKDYDVQSAAVRSAKNAKEHSEDVDGSAQPLDAARQGQGKSGNALDGGGKSKAGGGETAGKGPFMDQVGGQEGSNPESDVTVGKKEDVAGESWTDAAKKTLQGKNPTRFFHTSAIRRNPTGASEPSSDAGPASRSPSNTDVEGDQNPHLKHKSPSAPDTGKGNAAADPHLPSKQANKSASGSAATEPAHGDTKATKTTSRSFSTSARSSAIDPSSKSTGTAGSTPPGQVSEASKADESKSKQTVSPTSADLNNPKGDVGDKTNLGSTSTEATGAATHGGGVGKGVSQGQAKKPMDASGATASGGAGGQKRGYATKPPGGYSKALETEPTKSGYNAPPTALPSNLDSAYSSSAIDRDTSNLTPSNQTAHSSTSNAAPNEALRQAALDAQKGDGAGKQRNQQPDGEVGKLGLNEAWKHRNVG